MLIGAGEAGRTLIQEIQNSRYLDQKICCVIDDNRRKIGRYILGIRVVGDRNAIKEVWNTMVLNRSLLRYRQREAEKFVRSGNLQRYGL